MAGEGFAAFKKAAGKHKKATHAGRVHSITHDKNHPKLARVEVHHGDGEDGFPVRSTVHVPTHHAQDLAIGDRVLPSVMNAEENDEGGPGEGAPPGAMG